MGQEAEKDGGGRLKAIIDTVIGNLQTSITNVHIRYEVRADLTTALLLLFDCCHTQPTSNISQKNRAFGSHCIPYEHHAGTWSSVHMHLRQALQTHLFVKCVLILYVLSG